MPLAEISNRTQRPNQSSKKPKDKNLKQERIRKEKARSRTQNVRPRSTRQDQVPLQSEGRD